jgi:uncharacterized protein (DUF427 family)
VSLTAGTGPFSAQPAGRLNFELETPTGAVLFFDPVPQRIRGFFADACVFDTTHAKLLHETKHLPVYYIPDDDLDSDLLVPSESTSHCPHKGDARYWSIRVGDRIAEDAAWAYPEPIAPAAFLVGHTAFYWPKLDAWFAEDEQLFGHPRDPFTRIDVYRSARRIRVLLDGEVLADSVQAKALFETGQPTRWYIPTADVRLDLLEQSATVTRCAYKGLATHWQALGHTDVAWSYPEPQHDAEPIRDMIAFYDERVDVEIDGEAQDRPFTQWSRERPERREYCRVGSSADGNRARCAGAPDTEAPARCAAVDRLRWRRFPRCQREARLRCRAS